ncbi:MAG: hypothetical protein LBB78_11500, partial [Spirochaetaceae bacterium]|nr:hypothetical protein [Spirochaetaceae bacterium]
NLPEDIEYLRFLGNRVAVAIALASKRLKPSEISFGNGWLDGYSFCRIYKMKDGSLRTNPYSQYKDSIVEPYRDIDKTVQVIEIKQEGKITGILVNFICHCDVVGSETGISADFPGELRRCLKEKYGKDVIVLYLQGACGNINHYDVFHWNVTSVPHRYKEIGKALADEVEKIMKDMKIAESDNLGGIERKIIVKLQKPDEKLISWMKKTIAETAEDMGGLGRFEKEQVDLYFAKQAMGAHTSGITDRKTTLQVLNIAELGIYASPGELFQEFADELIAKSPFKRTFVSAYSNDYIGYIVTPDLCRVDGVYEGRQTSSRTFEKEAGPDMNREFLKMGEELFKNRNKSVRDITRTVYS